MIDLQQRKDVRHRDSGLLGCRGALICWREHFGTDATARFASGLSRRRNYRDLLTSNGSVSGSNPAAIDFFFNLHDSGYKEHRHDRSEKPGSYSDEAV